MYKTLCTLLLACCTVAVAHADKPDHFWRGHHRMVYPVHSRPYGKNMISWAELSLQWVYAQPLEQNPVPDPTGAHCAVGQDADSPVWFLAPIASMAPGNYTRFCTIPHGKAILLQIGFYSDTWPCPDPNFGPAPGQTLYEFLAADASNFMFFDRLRITLDGRRVRHPLRYKYLSENLFTLKGDPSLQSAFDPCITGEYQPEVVYGYFMMFRPLSRGPHVIVRRSVGMTGNVNTFTYFIDVQ